MKANRYLIALVAALGLIPIALDSTIVVVALTPIRTDLHASVNTAQWIFTGYLLANAATVAVGGYLANRFGRRRLFVLGIALFTVGSALCAVAPSIGWLIAFRVLQGIGGGVLLPIGPAIAFDAFPKEERARASAAVAIPLLLAPVFGPIAGGYLNDAFGWHSVFLVNLPVGVIAIAVALLVLPRDDAAHSTARFDVVGLALSTIGIVAILYALTLVTQTNPSTVSATNPGGDLYGWGYWPVWALLAVGGVALVVFAVYALRFSRDPALDLKQLGRYDFLVSNLLTWSSSLVTFGLLVLLPVYFESVRLPPLTALQTGVALVPFGVGTLLGTVGAAGLYRAIGPRWVAAFGVALSALSAWLLAHTIQPTANAQQLLTAAQTHTSVPSVAGPGQVGWLLFLIGLSLSFIIIPSQTLALEALTGEALTKASSLLLSTKLIFASVGVAIITTIFVDRTRSRATDLISQLQALIGGAGGSPSNPQALAALRALEAQLGVQAGAWAIQSIFWLIFFGALGVIVLALLLPGRRRHLAATQPEQPEATQPVGEQVTVG